MLSREKRPLPIWECAAPPGLYKEELLDHVDRFLFHDTERGCRYLRISSAASSRWFNGLEAVLREPSKKQEGETAKQSGETMGTFESWSVITPISLSPLESIEVFLTNYGVGLLSLSLRPKIAALDFAGVTLFNYKLSQLRTYTAPRLRIPHASENEKLWKKLSEAQKANIAPSPNSEAPLSERLGHAGGSFRLAELISEVLLGPLKALQVTPVQNQLSVYSALRYGPEVDFEQEAVRTALASSLSAVAQIEEPSHAGAPRGTISVSNAILNRRHWAAVSSQATVHIVSDQPELDHKYNEQRLPRVMLKYFIPYLMAWLQRTSLQGTIGEASRFVLSDQNSATGLAKLRKHMLEFAVDGYVPKVSDRESVHRYYGMVQEGLGVRRAFEDASRAITGIDAQFASEHQTKIAEALLDNAKSTRTLQTQMTEHLHVVADVQRTVGWIEVFFASVYLAELWHLFATHVDRFHHWLPHGVIAAAVLGALGAAVVLKPWRHAHRVTDQVRPDRHICRPEEVPIMNSGCKHYEGKQLRHVLIEDRPHINQEDFFNIIGLHPSEPNCADDIVHGENIELETAVLFARSHAHGNFADWLDEEFGLKLGLLPQAMTSPKFNFLV
jgi:hypothetical protein